MNELMNEHKKLRELTRVIERTPIIKITLLSPTQMTKLYNFKDENPEKLKIIHDSYSLLVSTEANDFYHIISSDILIRDIYDPGDTKYYIELRKQYQMIQKYAPQLIPIFFFKEDEESFIENKYKNIIDLSLRYLEKYALMDTIVISTKYNPFSTNSYMQGLVDKVIHTNFDVINEIGDNELFKKYYVIKKKGEKENDRNAD